MMTNETLEKSPEQLIVEHLKENGQSISWLARKMNLTHGYVFLMLKGKEYTKKKLTETNRELINSILKTNF